MRRLKGFRGVAALSLALCLAGPANGEVPDPDPARFTEQINRFVEWDSKNAVPENGILFVGSSSIRDWTTAVAFPNEPIINRGFGGSELSDVIHYYDAIIKPYSPAQIFVYAGDNDIDGGKSAQQVFADYGELVALISADFPDVEIVFISIKPSKARWSKWPVMVEANDLVRAYTGDHANLAYLDLATPLLDANGEPADVFVADGLHLNERGYALWQQALATYLDGDAFEFVGTLSIVMSAAGTGKLLLTVGSAEYELALHWDTEYIDIQLMNTGAPWVDGGRYGVNGRFDGSRLVADQVRYLGDEQSQSGTLVPFGGPMPMLTKEEYAAHTGVQEPSKPPEQDDEANAEKPFFTVDKSATGPLTLAELQINFPDDMVRRMSDQERACFLGEAEKLALLAGDPATLDPAEFPFLGNEDPERWARISPYMKRVLVAQAIVSWAFMPC